MNKTVIIWLALVALLSFKSFQRPSYAVGLYMLTFLVHPMFWWWGDLVQGYRWNLFAGILLLGTLILTNGKRTATEANPLNTGVARILFVILLNAVFVHFMLAANPESSMGWLTNRLKFVLLFFLLQYSIRDQKDYRIVAMSILFGIGYIGYEATINERGSFNGGRLEGIGAAGVQSANQLASLLVTALPLGTTVLFTRTARWIKVVAILCCAFTLNLVLLCNSRGAFLGVLASALVFIVLASGPARKHSRRLGALAIIGTFLLLGDPRIIERFMTIFQGTQADASAQHRIVFWNAAGEMLTDYPLGSGGNSFSEGRGWRYMGASNPGETRAIHNGFLTEATDWGVQGISLMLLFLLAVWLVCWRGRRLALAAGDANAVLTFACIAGSLAGWAVSSVFGDYLNDEWGLWTAALACAYLRVQILEPVAEESPASKPFAVPAGPFSQPARGSSVP